MNFRKFFGGTFFVFVLFVVIGFGLFIPVFFGKISLNANSLVSFSDLYGENLPYKNISNDHLREFFPYYKFTFTSLRNFQLPFWNPYAFSGQPFIASYQTAVFYPFNVLIFELLVLELLIHGRVVSFMRSPPLKWVEEERRIYQ